jgi:hypothetical protein
VPAKVHPQTSPISLLNNPIFKNETGKSLGILNGNSGETDFFNRLLFQKLRPFHRHPGSSSTRFKWIRAILKLMAVNA